MEINKELLLKDIKFPLYTQIGMYLFDSENNMVAELYNKHLYDKVIGEYMEVDGDNISNDYKLVEGDFIYKGEVVGLVRGWGRLQYEESGEERQDNIANYLLNLLNSK